MSKGTAVPTRAPADTLARMAQTVGATPEQLREAGREDAADELEALESFRQDVLFPMLEAPPTDFNRAVELARQIVNAPPTPHDEHFNRAERLLSHAHESVRRGHYLGAIHSLEGVESTVELLIDRVTGSAIRQREEQVNAMETAPQSATSAEGDEGEEAGGGEEVVRPLRPAHWDDAPPPPPIELADAASVGHKESDKEDDASE